MEEAKVYFFRYEGEMVPFVKLDDHKAEVQRIVAAIMDEVKKVIQEV